MRALLLLMLALPASAQLSFLDDTEYVTTPVSVKESALPAGAATDATSVAISTTLTAVKARADVLATEATAAAISTTAAAIKARADLLGTEATSAAISTTAAAIKARADLLGTESTLAAISTTAAAVKARTDLLATQATLALFEAKIATAPGGVRVETTQAVGTTATVKLTDSQGDSADVLSDGSLKVTLSPPSAPVNTTARSHTGDSTVATSSSTVFVIPSGSTMTLQRVFGGAGTVTVGGGKVEVFFDPPCTNVAASMTLLAKAFLSGANFDYSLNDSMVGNGTACVRLTRTNLGGGSVEIYTRWTGYTNP